MATMTGTRNELTNRARSFLRAVAAGRGQLACSCEPDLFIDDMSCGDQFTAHALTHLGLIRPARPAPIGQRVPAVLTPAGWSALHPESVAA